ncbi:MAG TPA: hypothetical protein V6D09_24965 [Leptolyngbyaceae cyanobacterium]
MESISIQVFQIQFTEGSALEERITKSLHEESDLRISPLNEM